MAEMKFSAAIGNDEPGDSRPFGPILIGALLVAIGVAMLAERTNLLPDAWRLQIWPVLLMAFGVARLMQPARRGRRGLFYVLAGAWWLAGLQGLLSFERTWPLLIVFYGASVVFQAVTSQPGLPRDAFPRRRDSGMSWVLVAILVGTFISAGGGQDWAKAIDDDGRLRMVSMMGRSEHHIQTDTFNGAEVVTVMGRHVIDLRDLPPGAPSEITLDGFTTMGSTMIRVPQGWTVEMRATAVMGRARDSRASRAAARDWDNAGVPAQPVPDGATSGTPAPRRLVVRGLVLMGELAVTQ